MQLVCAAEAKSVASAWANLSPKQKQQPLWLSQKGKKLSASAIGRMFATLVNDCVASNMIAAVTTPHAFRHTCAHRYLDQNPGDVSGVARILGHESLETTKIYLRLTADDLAQRIERMPINAYG
jgi:site-specific recombinase XerC